MKNAASKHLNEMGRWERVTITLVIIALIQIACRHCMPRTPPKASLKRYLNDLKPVKNNPVTAPYSPVQANKKLKQTFGKTAQNGRIGQNSLPKKSLYETYNFPETEYPLDNSPRDPFHIGMNYNKNYHVNTLQNACNLQSSAISDLKKEMKMKRRLLSNKQVNNENSQLKTDISSIKFSSNPNPIRLLDSETFPEVQYPLNTMETWGPNYWNYLPFTQEKSFHKFGQQSLNPTAKQDLNKPFTRLTKAKASKYLQSYDKLKDEHRRNSTENSKRSNAGQKGLNFTKTLTCEKVSDDFMTAGLVSNNPSNSTEIKKALTSFAKVTTSSESTCPFTEYPYHPMPIPYKVIEENTENFCPADELKNKTKELQDVDNSVIAQTLQLIQEILFNDDTCSTVLPGNYSKEIEKNMNTSDYTVFSAHEDISTTLMDSAKNCTVSPTEKLSQEVSNDGPACNLRNNMTSLPAELIPENTTTVTGPLNVRLPLPFSRPITYEALANAPNPSPAPLPNGKAVPGSTSVIIIPFNNNAVDKAQSHMSGTSPDTPIIVYIPSTHSSEKPSQPSPFNQIVSSSFDRPVPNNQVNNVLSNMAPLQVENTFSTALVSDLVNSNSDSGSSLPIHETLPTNSMCYNNESSPSSMREKPISDILIYKSLTDNAPFVTATYGDKLPEKPTETGDVDVNTNILPTISDLENPLFDFSSCEFTSLSQGLYNNILDNESPIIAREIDSDQEICNVSSTDLFMTTQNTKSEQLHKTIYMDSVSENSLSGIPNDVPPVALDKNFSSVTSTDNIEILKTNTLLPESITNLQEPVDTLTESPPQSIDKILLSTPPIETSTTELLLPTDALLTPAPLSETLSNKFPEIMDAKLSTTLLSDTAANRAQNHIGSTPLPPNLNSSLTMTDMTLKSELYKIREILDKMLSTETPTYNQPLPIDTTLLPNSDSNSLLLPINETPTETLPAVDKTLLPLPATDSPIDSLREMHETLPSISVKESPTDTLLLPGNKLVTQNKLLVTETQSLPIDETVPPTLVSHTFSDNKPYLIKNIVAPLFETVTSHTKDTPDNGLSHNMDDLALKIEFPDIYEVFGDNVPLSVDLPTKVHPEYTKIPRLSTNDLPTLVVETLTPVSEVPVRDLRKPTDVFSLPVNEVLEGASPDVLMDIVNTSTSGSIDKLLQGFSPSIVSSDVLPTLPMNEFKLSIHETFPDGQFSKISSKGPPQKLHLPLSMQKLIPDLSFFDPLTNESSLKDDSPSLVIQLLPVEKMFPNSEHTDNMINYVPFFKKPEDSSIADLSSEVPLSINEMHKDKPFIPIDDVEDRDKNENQSLDDPSHDLPELIDKVSPPKDTTKTSSSSKLPITKALLQNDLTDITTRGFSSLVAQSVPVTSLSVKNPVKSSISQNTENGPLLPIDEILPNTSLFDHPSDSLIISTEDTLPLPIEKIFSELQSLDIPTELSSPTDELRPDIPNFSMYDEEQGETENFSSDNLTDDHPLPMKKSNDISSSRNKTPLSSKLPITKELLEKVLSHINTKGFSSPVAKVHPVTLRSQLDKTLYFLESPVSDVNEKSSVVPTHNFPSFGINEDVFPRPIDKTLPYNPILDIPIDSVQNDKIHNSDILTNDVEQEAKSDILTDVVKNKDKSDNLADDIEHTDIPGNLIDNVQDIGEKKSDILTDDFEDNDKSINSTEGVEDHDKNETQSLDNPTHNLPVPVDKAFAPKDTTKTPSSLKLPITKALLENVLSDITTKGFSVSAAQSFPVPSVLDKTLSYIESPIFHMTKDSPSLPVDKILPTTSVSDLPLPVDKTSSELQSLDLPSLSLLIRPDIPIISMYDKEQDEIENPSSENLTDDLSSASPIEGILSLSKDMPSDRTLPNIKTSSSSKLLITKALLENVLSDIDTRGILFPEAKTQPVIPRSQLHKTLYFPETPVFDMTEKSSIIASDNFPPSGINVDIPDNPILYIPTDKLLIDKIHNTDIFTDDVEQEAKSDILADVIKDRDKSDNFTDNVDKDISDDLTDDIGDEDEEKSDISTDDLKDNDKSANLTDDVKYHEKNGFQFLDNPTHNLPVSIDKVSPPKDTTKTPSSLKLPITKALLENVLSDMTTRGFSVSAAQSFPVADKTLCYIESPIFHMTKDSPSLLEHKILSTTLVSDYPTETLLNSAEDTLPLPVDKTSSELQNVYIPTLSLPIRQDISIISMYGKEQDEIENPSSESLTDDLSSASPLKGILSLSKDTPSDLTLPNIKTPSSSKLPITKALLENVLSDIDTQGILFPEAKAHPVIPRSQLHKTLYFPESPVFDMTEKSTLIASDNFPPSGINMDIPDNPILYIPTDKLVMDKIHNTDILTDNVEQEAKSDILADVKHRDKSDNFSDIVDRDISDDSTDDIENEDEKKSGILTDELEDNDKSADLSDDVQDHDKNGFQSLDNPTHNVPVSLYKISPPKDTTKTPSSLKLPITKALLENVLSDITTRGLSVSAVQSFPVPSVLDKTLYYIESPIFHMTKDSPSLPVDKILPTTSVSDLPLPVDKTSSELQSLDLPSLSLPIRPDIPIISMYDKEKDESENPSSKNLTDDLSSASPIEGILSLSKDTPSDLTLPNIKTTSSSKLPITKVLLENVLSDIDTRGILFPEAKAHPVTPRSQLHKTLYFLESPVFDMTEKSSIIVKDRDKSDNFSDIVDRDISDDSTDDIENEDEKKSGILTDELEDNDKSADLSDDVQDHDKNGFQSLDNPTHNVPVSIDKVSPPKDTTKTPSSLKLPITKALLENVLSDITTRGLSVSAAQSFPVPSVLDKTLYYIESPIFHMTKDSPSLPVDKILPTTSVSDLPLPVDKTSSELHSLDLPTLSLLIRPDIPIITMYDKEQDDIENPSSENLTDDLSSAWPIEGIRSLSKDTPSNFTLPNIKTTSSSKLPITKALLENVLSDINTQGILFAEAKAHPVTPRSQLHKTLYFLESPVFDMTEKSSIIASDNFPSSGINVDVPDKPILFKPTEKLVMHKIHNTGILTDDVQDRYVSNNLTDCVKNEDKFDILSDDVERDKSNHLTNDIAIEDSNESLFSEDSNDDLPSDLPLPQTKQYLASRIPKTKALLEKVLTDITDGGINS